MSQYYELVIFTASMKEYAVEVIQSLDTQKCVSYSLYRDSCSIVEGCYVKDISRLGRPLKDVILVDNSEVAFYLQPSNGILVKNFINDEKDIELYNLADFLEFLADVEDVRPLSKWLALFYASRDEIKYLSRTTQTEQIYSKKLRKSEQPQGKGDENTIESAKDLNGGAIESKEEKNERSDLNSPRRDQLIDSFIRRMELQMEEEEEDVSLGTDPIRAFTQKEREASSVVNFSFKSESMNAPGQRPEDSPTKGIKIMVKA